VQVEHISKKTREKERFLQKQQKKDNHISLFLVFILYLQREVAGTPRRGARHIICKTKAFCF